MAPDDPRNGDAGPGDMPDDPRNGDATAGDPSAGSSKPSGNGASASDGASASSGAAAGNDAPPGPGGPSASGGNGAARQVRAMDERMQSAFKWALSRLPGKLGSRLEEATGGRFGIGSQIVVWLGGGVTMTVSAIILALVLMSIVQSRQSEVTEGQMPALVAAFEVSKRSEALVRASPQLLAANNPEDLEEVLFAVTIEQDSLRAWIARAEIQVREGTGESEGVGSLADTLVESINQIHESVRNRMIYQDQLDQMATQVAATGLRLQSRLEEAVDEQHFFMFTGLRELDDFPAPITARRSVGEIDHYAGLLNFRAAQNETITLIQQAFTQTDRELLRANQERVETALSDVRDNLARVRQPLRDSLAVQVELLGDLYGADAGIFMTRTRELDEIRQAAALLARNQQTTADLVTVVDGLVDRAEAATRDAAEGSSALVTLGFWFLLGATVLILGAAYFVWRVFGQRLLARLGGLFDVTRRMSSGDLEVEVEIEGNDEVTDMAGALEVFRKHALEVQRLNLVEQLAEEVHAKNSALQETLEDLRRTQQQVVTQEKLASLGALTAGIAHEIRNPLNFVNNFAVLSIELIEELREEVGELKEEEGAAPGEAAENGDAGGAAEASSNGELDAELVAEILDDLEMNIGKVREHGTRADRIVEGMLAHSRDEAGQVESVNINLLVDEYAKLAYHGLRGTDSSFNVTLDREFDENAGAVNGIARDLSRVFLNVVTNACHATAARRQESDDPSYSPVVRLKTEGRDDEVVVSVRDNGTGIPDAIREKIFEPFFTTKTGTHGTGLGLSLSHEIILSHGGKVEVDTEPGEFTEFRITLPRESSMAVQQ